VTLGAFTALWLSQPAQFIPGGQDLPFIWALLITLFAAWHIRRWLYGKQPTSVQ